MKRLKVLPFLILLLPLPVQAQKNQQIAGIIAQVNLDSIKQTVMDLTGLNPVMINGNQEQILSRHYYTAGNALVAPYFTQRLEAYGYDAQMMGFDTRGQNIYAVKKGTTHFNRAYLICAHYDAISQEMNKSVGADDNASGCAAVMEAARLFKDVSTEYSLIFVFFDEEERGMLGSYAFTSHFDFGEMAVEGVINVDMIGYDGNQDFRADINVRDYGYSKQLADIVRSLNDTFSTGLDLEILPNGSLSSDHAPFWYKGISGIFLEEDNMDFNPYYHTNNDSLVHFHDSFFYRYTTLIVASLGWFVLDGDFVLASHTPEKPAPAFYPNPASQQLSLTLFTSGGLLRLYDMQGRLSLEKELVAGDNGVDISLLGPGVYQAEINEGANTTYRKLLILRP